MPISRVQLLRGDLSGRRSIVRPPWALDEAQFVDACSRCGDCVAACTEQILEKGRGGFPQVNFSLGECSFCGDCVSACDDGALRSRDAGPWHVRATIDDTCLEHRGISCRSCGDQCEAHVIQFKPVVGGTGLPQLELSLCNGCGACVRVCPEGAITVSNFHPHEQGE